MYNPNNPIKTRKKPVYRESPHQRAFMQWVNIYSTRYPEVGLIYCNHNTQLLADKIKAGRWKALGGKAGIPDLFLPVGTASFNGLYIEFKSPDKKPKTSKSAGGVSKDQQKMFGLLREQNYKVIVCYDVEEAIEEVKLYMREYYLFKNAK